ncbi:MAG TPA: TonB-dependent receptor [Tahibacter sp.]|uniref:TonB-dependent receptor n=1 Tax=Tahibacter sp. TaxID=2056211 RepID=UPI002CFFE93E|nr:TonB-dependent receptor [Tahibacter sp.]HSX61570.1 TonB-dependent receptor [Tahibacter sp.]
MSYPSLPLRRTLLSVFLAAGLASPAFAQSPAASPQAQSQGLIRGQAVLAGGQPLAGVRVTVQGLSDAVQSVTHELVTDAEGRFQAAVPAGEFGLTAQADGYDLLIQDGLQVRSGGTAEAKLVLGAAGAATDSGVAVDAAVASAPVAADADGTQKLGGVNVRGSYQRGGEALYLDEKRASPVVAETLGAEQIARTGDSDAATTLKRVTGLTLVDGRFVYVRGLGERYSSVALNGAPIPSPDPTRRVVPLDLFPTDLLDGVVVQKGYTPDMPGEFGGGAVLLRTRDVPSKFFVRINGTLGYQDGTSFKDGYTYEGGGQDWTGDDDGTRELPDSLAAATAGGLVLRPQTPLNPTGATPAELERYGEDVAAGGYDVKRETLAPDLGFSAAIGNRRELGDGSKLGFTAATRYNQGWDRNEEIRRTFQASSAGLEPADSLAIDDTRRNVDFSAFLNLGYELSPQHRFNATSVLLRQTEDRTKISEGVQDEQQARFTELRWTENQLFAQQLGGNHVFPGAHDLSVDWQYTWARANRDEPDTRRYRYDRALDGSLSFSQRSDSNQMTWAELADYQRDLTLKGKLPFDFDSATLDLSFGGERMERSRDASLRSFSFSAAGPLARDPAVLALPIDEVLSPGHIGEDGFVLTESTLPTDNYFARQDLTAFFLGLDANIAQKYRIALGARREKNDQAVTTFSLSNPDAPPVVAGEDTRSTLPAAAFTWSYSDDAQVRASYSKTLSRPDFRELSPAPYLDPLLDVQVVGNPELVSASIRNYDLRWEYYFSPVETISIGAFLKEFENPIEKTRLPGSGVLLSLDNAQSARNYGVEFDVSKGLEFVADWPGFRHIHGDWANWSVGFNYARIKSRIQLDPLDASFQTNLNRPMQGQSPYVANLQIGHQAGDDSSEATLLYNVSGRRIAAVGVAGQPDIYEEAFRQLDFQYRRALGEDWSMKLRLRNLLDPAVRYTQGPETTRDFKKGRALMLTFEWKPQ